MKPKAKPPAAPSKISVARIQAFIRSRFNPIRNLDPATLSTYLDEFKCGYLRNCALTWTAIRERDDMLCNVIGKREKAASRNGWEILTLDSIEKNQVTEADRHKQALEYFYNNLTAASAIDDDERGEVSLLVRQMMSAIGMKYAVHEIIWQPGLPGIASGATPGGLTAQFRFAPLWFFENTTGKLQYLQQDYAMTGIPLEPGAWLITVADGLMAASSVAYMYKHMSLKDWVIYNQRHGMPGIHGKTDAAEGSTEWDDLVTAVQNFAAEWALVTNSGASIDKIDMSAPGQLPYPPLVERMDRAIAAIWRGADLSTISAGAGQGQGASVQADETSLLEADDAQLISETLNRQVDRRVIEYTFGAGVKPLAYFKLKTATKKNVELDLKVDQALHTMGAPIAVQSLLERYARPLPADADVLLPAAVPPAATNAGGDPDSGTGLPLIALSTRENARGPAPLSAGQNFGVRQHVAAFPPQVVPEQLLQSALAQALSVRPEWLRPLAPWFAALEKKIADKTLTDSELLAELESAAKQLPELFDRLDISALAKVLEETMSAAVVNGMTETQPLNPEPLNL